MSDGNYKALKAERIIQYRTKEEQLPKTDEDLKLINTIHDYFKDNAFGFEKCAAEIVKLMDNSFISYELTRHYVDGGRDAIGKYAIGQNKNIMYVDYALEAKCYSLNNAIGVKEISRLISRIRQRQFGVFVTTSYVHHQAYKEITEDGHPIIILSAKDIVDILKKNGFDNVNAIKKWLD